MAAANGFGRVMVGQGGILSTPAASQRHPQVQGLRRHRPVGQPQSRRPARGFRHQVQHRQWRPGAGEDHRRDLRAHQGDQRLPDRRRRPTSTSTRIGTVEARRHDGRGHRSGRRLCRADGERCSTSTRSATMFAGGFRMRFDAMHAVTGPMPRRSSRTGSARRTARRATSCRCRISAATIPTRTSSTPRHLYDEMMGAGRAGFRRRVRRRRRPQPDHRQAASSSRRRTAWRCSPPTRIWRRATRRASQGIARSMPTSARRRPRRREARHRHATRRRPAGSSSATCSTPAWRRSAARRAPAPAPTMCARRTGCGPCCSGSTSSPCAARASRTIVERALGDLRPQLLFAPRLRGGRDRRAPTR